MPKPWKRVSSRPVGEFRIFSIRSDRTISPRTGKEHDFFVIDCANWVNVIALTPDQQLVMIEQYRHGSNTVELEIPGGMVDASDASPESCANVSSSMTSAAPRSWARRSGSGSKKRT